MTPLWNMLWLKAVPEKPARLSYRHVAVVIAGNANMQALFVGSSASSHVAALGAAVLAAKEHDPHNHIGAHVLFSVAAQGIETATAAETCNRLGPEGESPVGEADAPKTSQEMGNDH